MYKNNKNYIRTNNMKPEFIHSGRRTHTECPTLLIIVMDNVMKELKTKMHRIKTC